MRKRLAPRACYRLGAAKLRGEKRCVWCGKLLGKKAHAGQKYCSNACGAAGRRLNKVENVTRCCITTHNSGAWRKRLAELARERPFEEKSGRRIFLVCGLTGMKAASTEWMANFIRYELKSDPFDGNMYLFCGNERSQLKWLCWDGSGFVVGVRKSEAGTYPWPVETTKPVMEITEGEYRFLRSGYSGGSNGKHR